MNQLKKVTQDNFDDVSIKISNAIYKQFGENVLDESDEKWEETINPWIDKYIEDHYELGEVTKEELDDLIIIELGNREYDRLHPLDQA